MEVTTFSFGDSEDITEARTEDNEILETLRSCLNYKRALFEIFEADLPISYASVGTILRGLKKMIEVIEPIVPKLDQLREPVSYSLKQAKELLIEMAEVQGAVLTFLSRHTAALADYTVQEGADKLLGEKKIEFHDAIFLCLLTLCYIISFTLDRAPLEEMLEIGLLIHPELDLRDILRGLFNASCYWKYSDTATCKMRIYGSLVLLAGRFIKGLDGGDEERQSANNEEAVNHLPSGLLSLYEFWCIDTHTIASHLGGHVVVEAGFLHGQRPELDFHQAHTGKFIYELISTNDIPKHRIQLFSETLYRVFLCPGEESSFVHQNPFSTYNPIVVMENHSLSNLKAYCSLAVFDNLAVILENPRHHLGLPSFTELDVKFVYCLALVFALDFIITVSTDGKTISFIEEHFFFHPIISKVPQNATIVIYGRRFYILCDAELIDTQNEPALLFGIFVASLRRSTLSFVDSFFKYMRVNRLEVSGYELTN